MAPPCLQAGTLAVHHKLLASGSAPTRNIIIHAPAQAYMFIPPPPFVHAINQHLVPIKNKECLKLFLKHIAKFWIILCEVKG